MKQLNEQELEKLLQSLPKFERSAQAEAKFFKKLEGLAEKKRLEGALESEEKTTWFAWPKLAFVGSFAALILIVSGTFAAYQPTVTRGTFLYPWKQATERVELAFAFTSLQKVDTHVRFSDRRLSEAENIVAKNPSLAWLVEKASAHEEEVHLGSENAVHLAKTLADMRREISLASEIVETKISAPEQAERALEKIEVASDRHIEILAKMEEKGGKEVKDIVKRVAEEEDEHLASVIEVKEKVKAAKARKEKEIKVKFEKREEKLGEKRADRKEEAKEEFIEAVRVFQKLPEEQKKHLEEQLERAKEALEEGKFGRTKGLSRALQNELKEKPTPKEEPDPGFKPTPKEEPDPGFKPGPEKEMKKEKDETELKEFDVEPINIYNDPLLSPPKPEDLPERPEREYPKIKPFLMELEDVKDSEGIFEENHVESGGIKKIFEKMPSAMEFKRIDYRSK